MKIYNSVEEFSPDFKVVLTLGTFDGVHIGHQSIVRQLNKNAQKIGGESVLLTFYPHPRYVIFPDDQKLKLLTTIEERSRMLENYGLDHLIIQEFTPEFSRIKSTSPKVIEFVTGSKTAEKISYSSATILIELPIKSSNIPES